MLVTVNVTNYLKQAIKHPVEDFTIHFSNILSVIVMALAFVQLLKADLTVFSATVLIL